MHPSETVAARIAHSRTRTRAPAHAPFLARTCECAACASVDPMWAFRVVHAGNHVAGPTLGWDPIGAEWHTGRTNTTQQTSNMPHFTPHCQFGRLLHVPPSCKLRASTHRTRVSTRVPMWVPDVSTHRTRFGSPRQCSERPMRVPGVFMRASKVPHAGTPSTHESTRSILSDRLQ